MSPGLSRTSTMMEATDEGDGKAEHGEAVARFMVGGMTCSSCVGIVESSVGAVPGVAAVKVSLVLNSAEVHYHPALVRTLLF